MLRGVLIVVGIAAVAGMATAAFVGFGLTRDAREARSAFDQAQSSLGSQDANGARSAFERARAAFASMQARLDGALALPLRVAPVASRQVEIASAIARAGAHGARAGTIAADAVDAAPEGGWGFRQGRIDLDAARRAGRIFDRAASEGGLAVQQLADAPQGSIGPVTRTLSEAEDRLGSAVDGLRLARDGLSALPSLLGAEGPKRYLVAFANLAELRGTGGFLGYFSTVEVSDGKITVLAGGGRPADDLPPLSETKLVYPEDLGGVYRSYGITDLWQNVNMPIDFPSVGSLIMQGASTELGPLDGVIQIDSVGIAALLRVAGPVRVSLWPEAVSADNVTEITQHDMYVRYRDDRRSRTNLIARLVDTVFSEVLSTDLSFTSTPLAELGRATGGGHIRVFSRHPGDQTALERVRMAGEIARVAGATDVLGLVTANGAANKIDWFLRRDVRYEVQLDPDGASAHAEMTASLRNLTPTGEPTEVAGSRGTNEQIILVARPPSDQLSLFEVGGVGRSVARGKEGPLGVYHSGARIERHQTTKVSSEFTVPDAFEGTKDERTYRLHILRQPVAHPDFYEVSITAPTGWSVAGDTRFVGDLEADLVMEVELRRNTASGLINTIFVEPWRTAVDLVGSIF